MQRSPLHNTAADQLLAPQHSQFYKQESVQMHLAYSSQALAER